MQTDPRGPRFAAVLTTLVLAAVLITGSGPLLAAQAVVFAIGAFLTHRARSISAKGSRLSRLVPSFGPAGESVIARRG